jgi:hypothetical protein
MANRKLKTDGYGAGKHCSQEQSIISHLKEMVKTDAKVYFIIWKYAPDLLPKQNIKTFKNLTDNYKTFTSGMTEISCENWLYEQNVQTAIKWLLERIHQAKMIELYNIYFDRAKTDTNAFKAFIEFSNQFFAQKQDSELLGILKGVNLDDDAEDESE